MAVRERSVPTLSRGFRCGLHVRSGTIQLSRQFGSNYRSEWWRRRDSYERRTSSRSGQCEARSNCGNLIRIDGGVGCRYRPTHPRRPIVVMGSRGSIDGDGGRSSRKLEVLPPSARAPEGRSGIGGTTEGKSTGSQNRVTSSNIYLLTSAKEQEALSHLFTSRCHVQPAVGLHP